MSSESVSNNVSYRDSALIVWDMQYGIAGRAFNLKEVTENTKLLIEAAHNASLPVVYSQMTGLNYEARTKFLNYMLQRRGLDPKTASFMAEGSKDWQILSELAPHKEDIVIKKNTPSFFVGTLVEQVLRSKRVETLILAGVSTDVGIEATARHGACLGFIPVIAEDAVGTHDILAQEQSLAVMRRMFEVRAARDIIQSILSAPKM